MSRSLLARVPIFLTALATALMAVLGLTGAAPAHADAPIATTVTVDLSGAQLNFGTPAWYYGNISTVTATVTSDSGTPVGSVTFLDGDGKTMAADVPVDSDGVAQYTFRISGDFTNVIVAQFHGADGYADSTSEPFVFWIGSGPTVVTAEPSILRLSPLGLTLSMRVKVTRNDGTPLAGREVRFTLLNPPPLGPIRHPDPWVPLCTATTDAAGNAGCTGGGGNLAALLSILGGGAWATVTPAPYYQAGWAQVPLVR